MNPFLLARARGGMGWLMVGNVRIPQTVDEINEQMGAPPVWNYPSTTQNLTPEQIELARRQAASGVGMKITSAGVLLSDGTTIKWTTIGIVVLGFVLLQSKGFSKK